MPNDSALHFLQINNFMIKILIIVKPEFPNNLWVYTFNIISYFHLHSSSTLYRQIILKPQIEPLTKVKHKLNLFLR